MEYWNIFFISSSHFSTVFIAFLNSSISLSCIYSIKSLSFSSSSSALCFLNVLHAFFCAVCISSNLLLLLNIFCSFIVVDLLQFLYNILLEFSVYLFSRQRYYSTFLYKSFIVFNATLINYIR